MEATSPIGELRDRFREAATEISPSRARTILQTIRSECRRLVSEGRLLLEAAVLGAEASGELASMAASSEQRARLRGEALAFCRGLAGTHPSDLAALAFARETLHFAEDPFHSADRSGALTVLAEAQGVLDARLEQEKAPHRRSRLLSHKVALLRSKAHWERRRGADWKSDSREDSADARADLYRRRLEEAKRCAQVAEELDAFNTHASVQHGLVLWDVSRLQRSMRELHESIILAEDKLVGGVSSEAPVNYVHLCRFYLRTHRPFQAARAFEVYELHETHVRRHLSASSAYAEAVLRMRRSDYPDETVGDRLARGQTLLQRSIDAGYENARALVLLASLEAESGARDLSEGTLFRLVREEVGSCLQVYLRAQEQLEQGQRDGLMRAFVLGIADPGTWRLLGDYATQVLRDAGLAVKLLQMAIRLGTRSPDTMAQLGNARLMMGTREALHQAELDFNEAGKQAAPDFVSWRAGLRDARMRLGTYRAPSLSEAVKRNRSVDNFKDLQRSFLAIRGAEQPHERLLAELVVDLLSTTHGIRKGGSGSGPEDTFLWNGHTWKLRLLRTSGGVHRSPRQVRSELAPCMLEVLQTAPDALRASGGVAINRVLLTWTDLHDILECRVPAGTVMERAWVRARDVHEDAGTTVSLGNRQEVEPPATDQTARTRSARTHPESVTQDGRRMRALICYAREDQERVDTFRRHLSSLKHFGQVELWFDRMIDPGEDWQNSLDQRLNEADLIFLMISADFFHSDYCREVEMPRAIERYERGEAQVIPVLLRPCDWAPTPIAKLQCLPRSGDAITSSPDPAQAMADVAKEVRERLGIGPQSRDGTR